MDYMNEVLMESIMDFVTAQPASDQMIYRRALEATEPAGRARLVVKLYEECLRSNNVDYGSIPDSRGNILKLKHYDTTAETIDLLNKLFKDQTLTNELKLLNDYHDMLLKSRDDFEYAYKYNIEIIKVMYCNMVRALYDLIDMCVVSYAEYLKNAKENAPKMRTVRKTDTLLVKCVKQYLALYKKGDWARMMKFFKDPAIARANESYLHMQLESLAYTEAPLMEADGDSQNKNDKSTTGRIIDGFTKIFSDEFKNDHPTLGGLARIGRGVVVVLGALIVAFHALRGMIRFFIRSSGKIASYTERQADLLKESMDAAASRGDDNEKARKKQEKWYNFFQNVSGFINAKILKADAEAKKDIITDNRVSYNKDDIVPPVSDGDYVFM